MAKLLTLADLQAALQDLVREEGPLPGGSWLWWWWPGRWSTRARVCVGALAALVVVCATADESSKRDATLGRSA
jgi:hypothetical protein